MKKYLLWLPIIFLIFSSAVNYIYKNATQRTTSKNIAFIVYKSIDYTSSIYNNTYVILQIKVEKVSNKNRALVLDKTCETKLIREYPALNIALPQTLTVRNFDNKVEQLEVTYTRTYYSNGSGL